MPPRGSGASRGGTRRGGRARGAAGSAPPPAPTPVTQAAQPASTAAQIIMAAEASAPVDGGQTASQPGPARAATRPPASTSARGAAGSSTSKYKPKGNRRTEEERRKIAEEQLKILHQRAAEDARTRPRARFRGRARGRGRGGFREFTISRGGGMFGPAITGPSASGRGGGGGGGGGGAGWGGRTGGSSGSGTPYSSTDGRVDDDRINADELRGRDRDDGDGYSPTGVKAATTKKKRSVLPVGIKREDVQEGGVELATAEDIAAGEAAAEEADDEDMWVDDGDAHRVESSIKKDDEVWTHVAPRRPEKVMVKNERGDLVEATSIDQIVADRNRDIKQPSSPEQHKKPLADVKKAGKGLKDPEAEQIAQDMERLVSLLTIGAQQHDQKPDAEGTAPYNALEGNLFLFQLPPVLPPLQIKSQPRSADGAREAPVKAEPADDVVMLDQPAANIDLTGASETPDRAVKAEDGVEAEDDLYEGETKEPLYPPEGGYVGKLVVRRSGKVELDWGGQTLEVVPGIQTNFLTTAVLVDETNPLARPSEVAGVAYGMGKIEGKFVLAPKWAEEEEWVVDPSELEVDGIQVGPCV